MNAQSMSARTAGIIVIGDEILKGMVSDTNSSFISKKLYSMGVKLKRISVIPDEVDGISAEIHEFSKRYDLVVTSGGVGPTHDDVTYEGVAKAFGEKLMLHKEMVNYVHQFYPDGQTISENPSLKMANLPSSAKIIKFKDSKKSSFGSEIFPIVRVFNVVLLPGIPQLLEHSFSRMEITDLFPNTAQLTSFPSTTKFHYHKLYYKADEVELVKTLNRAVGLFRKNVNFGSYPVLGKSYNTLIVIDSLDELLASRAKMYLKNEMPKGLEVPPPPGESSDDHTREEVDYSFVSREVSERVFRLLEHPDTPKSLLEPLDKAIKTVGNCFTRYGFEDGVFISFNGGGKDCTALLHLIFAFYTKHHPKGPPLIALYIQTKDPFDELEEFVKEAALRYNIKLEVRPGPLKDALRTFIDDYGSMKAVFIGTRRTDPKSVSLQPFQMTDGDWPRIMRVSPLLDWSYEHVWMFLRLLSVPYCSLYDEGYTSIGDKGNTYPNPALSYTTENGETKYHPAYMLQDETIERSGRQSEVLSYAAGLTSNLAEVIAPAFGPNGSAVLFSQKISSSANSTQMSPMISRMGLQMVEILVIRNTTNTVHPLLKPLLESCRQLDLEWGDGVKSLVLITSELLRLCSLLEHDKRPGWLRRHLGKTLDLLSKTCEIPINSNPSLSPHTTGCKQVHKKCFWSDTKQFVPLAVESVNLINPNSQFISSHYVEVINLLKMFFCTRFPLYVVEAVPHLLCEWVKVMESEGRGLDFVVDNFNSLCYVNMGVPLVHSSVVNGVLVKGSGIGHFFTSKSANFHKETCRYSLHDFDVDKSSSDIDSCPGCILINVGIINEHELSSEFGLGQDQFEFKANYLYLTSCIPSDFIKFKICQLGDVSVVHSIPVDDIDFLLYLMHNQEFHQSSSADCFYVNWVKRWTVNPSKNSGFMWLGIPAVKSLNLCVPIMGMKDGLKHSCYNALSLVRQLRFHSRHRCTENIKQSPSQISQGTGMNSRSEASSNHLNEDTGRTSLQVGTSQICPAKVIPLNHILNCEKLLSDHLPLTALGNMVEVGGLAEVLMHDMVISWWMDEGESLDREVAKAISHAILAVPISLSTRGTLIRKPNQPLAFNFDSKSKEMIAHRLKIVYHAVSVAFSLSNVSDVMMISKSTLKVNITSMQEQDVSSDSD